MVGAADALTTAEGDGAAAGGGGSEPLHPAVSATTTHHLMPPVYPKRERIGPGPDTLLL